MEDLSPKVFRKLLNKYIGIYQGIKLLVANLRKKKGDEGAANNNGVQNVPEVAAVAARVQQHSQV